MPTHHPRALRAVRRSLLAALVTLLAAVLGACSQLQGTNEGGYISGDGKVVQYAPADRGEPVEFSGQSLQGEPLDVTDSRGKVAVVNIWWSGCGPCRTEMPMLNEAHAELGDEVDFLGINTRDSSVETAAAFEEARGVAYPSVYAVDGQALLAFGALAREMPTTIVLDREGRVAAVIRGPVPSQRTITDLVEEVAAEDG